MEVNKQIEKNFMQEQLILDNHNLIYHILKNMNLYNQLDEYYDIAIIGLMKAAKNFDSNKKIKFSTYASTCIKNEICCYLRQKKSNKLKINNDTISLETVINSEKGNGILLKDTISSNINIEEDLIYQQEIMKLYEAISHLKKNERFVLEHYYGLNNKVVLKQYELAEILNTSQAYISRIIKRSLVKIKKEMGKYYVCDTK